jgi:NHLM bacteriocin system secretion protein
MAAPRQDSVFRKAALDRLASPEQLDLVMEVTSPRTWLALGALGVLVVTAVVWGFTGSIPTQVEAQGVLIKAGGVLDVFAQGSGVVTEVLVREGDRVTQGQVIARVAQPELDRRIRNAQAQLAEQQREHARLLGVTQRDLGLQKDSIELQRANLQDTIRFSEGRLNALQQQLKNEEGLLEKGLITTQQVLGTRQTIFTTQDQLERARGQLKQLTITDVSTQTQKDQETIRSQLALNEAQRQIDVLEEERRLQAEVRSPYDGLIIEVEADNGNLINRGASVASLQLSDDAVTSLETLIYIPASDGKHVGQGMSVQVSPLSAPREEYGYLIGETTYVSEFPATRQGMMRLLSNDNLVSLLSAGGAPYVAYAKLEPKPGTTAGYKWSSPKGEKLKVNTGMICRVTITVESRRPVELVVPTLREKLGL